MKSQMGNQDTHNRKDVKVQFRVSYAEYQELKDYVPPGGLSSIIRKLLRDFIRKQVSGEGKHEETTQVDDLQDRGG